MGEKDTIDLAIMFIREAHAGQRDKAGQPYWQHPVAVMDRLGKDAPLEEKLTALLHDVVEDTDWTIPELRAEGFPEGVLEAVRLLTRPRDRPYMEWIRDIAGSGNETAIRVKIADNEENSDSRRLELLSPAERLRLATRYRQSLAILRMAPLPEKPRGEG